MSREGGERKKESEKEKNSAFQTQRKPQLCFSITNNFNFCWTLLEYAQAGTQKVS